MMPFQQRQRTDDRDIETTWYQAWYQAWAGMGSMVTGAGREGLRWWDNHYGHDRSDHVHQLERPDIHPKRGEPRRHDAAPGLAGRTLAAVVRKIRDMCFVGVNVNRCWSRCALSTTGLAPWTGKSRCGEAAGRQECLMIRKKITFEFWISFSATSPPHDNSGDTVVNAL